MVCDLSIDGLRPIYRWFATYQNFCRWFPTYLSMVCDLSIDGLRPIRISVDGLRPIYRWFATYQNFWQCFATYLSMVCDLSEYLSMVSYLSVDGFQLVFSLFQSSSSSRRIQVPAVQWYFYFIFYKRNKMKKGVEFILFYHKRIFDSQSLEYFSPSVECLL
jgi:hypothetical protein